LDVYRVRGEILQFKKADVIRFCLSNRLPLVSTMAGGRSDENVFAGHLYVFGIDELDVLPVAAKEPRVTEGSSAGNQEKNKAG